MRHQPQPVPKKTPYRWKAVIAGMNVYFTHKPVRGIGVMVAIGYPIHTAHHDRRHKVGDVSSMRLRYDSWKHTIVRIAK